MEDNNKQNLHEIPSMSANMTSQLMPQNMPNNQENEKIAKSDVSSGYSGLYKSMNSNPSPAVPRRSRGFSFSLGLVLNYIFLIVSFVATVLIIVLLIIPQYNKYVENTAKVAETAAELDKVLAHYDYLKGLSDLQSEIESNTALSQRAIPIEENIPQLLNQVAIITRLSELDLIRNDFSGVTTNNLQDSEQESDSTRAKSINIRAQIRGNYANLISFLQNIERSQRLQSVGEIKVTAYDPPETEQEIEIIATPQPESSDGIVTLTEFTNQLYEINITLIGYYMKNPEISELPIEALVAKGSTDFGTLLNDLGQMTYYDLDTSLFETQLGREKPFIDPLLMQDVVEEDINVFPIEQDGFLEEESPVIPF
ncbi:MAG: hypothetical protein QG570_510 [Patescibacteria group bacterium]|nr:hypothetical protein [Patescibacteria group bacterium]